MLVARLSLWNFSCLLVEILRCLFAAVSFLWAVPGHSYNGSEWELLSESSVICFLCWIFPPLWTLSVVFWCMGILLRLRAGSIFFVGDRIQSELLWSVCCICGAAVLRRSAVSPLKVLAHVAVACRWINARCDFWYWWIIRSVILVSVLEANHKTFIWKWALCWWAGCDFSVNLFLVKTKTFSFFRVDQDIFIFWADQDIFVFRHIRRHIRGAYPSVLVWMSECDTAGPER